MWFQHALASQIHNSAQHVGRLVDTAYGTGEMLDWLDHQRGIAPHIPVFDKPARRDGTSERADFTYDAEQDTYTCPGGNVLKLSAVI